MDDSRLGDFILQGKKAAAVGAGSGSAGGRRSLNQKFVVTQKKKRSPPGVGSHTKRRREVEERLKVWSDWDGFGRGN